MAEPTVPEKVPAPFVPIDLQADGLLWLINRVVFHPRGYALSVTHLPDMANPERKPQIVFSLCGPGDEVWAFKAEDDDECFAKAEAAFARARDAHVQASGGRQMDAIVEQLHSGRADVERELERDLVFRREGKPHDERGRDGLTRDQRGPTS